MKSGDVANSDISLSWAGEDLSLKLSEPESLQASVIAEVNQVALQVWRGEILLEKISWFQLQHWVSTAKSVSSPVMEKSLR